jgi:hypothetical protein
MISNAIEPIKPRSLTNSNVVFFSEAPSHKILLKEEAARIDLDLDGSKLSASPSSYFASNVKCRRQIMNKIVGGLTKWQGKVLCFRGTGSSSKVIALPQLPEPVESFCL